MNVLINRFKKDKNLSKLKKSLSLFSVLHESLENLQILDKLRLKNPDNKLYAYIWVLIKSTEFDDDEYFEYELIDFFTEVFEKYGWLVKGNFFYENFNKILISEKDKWLSNPFFEVFLNASAKYPNNMTIKNMVLWAYDFRKEYEKSLDLAELRLKELDRNNDYYKMNKRFYLEHKATMLYKLGRFDEAIEASNYILYQMDYYDEYSDFVNARLFALKIDINLRKKNIEEVKKDCVAVFNLVPMYWIELFLYDTYPEAYNYFEKYIAELVKQHTSTYSKATGDKTFTYKSKIGKIEISGNDDWTKPEPFFDITLKSKTNFISIKMPDVADSNDIDTIEPLHNTMLSEDERAMIINWLNAPSLISKKNICIETTNYKYIASVWNLLNTGSMDLDIKVVL